MKQSDSASDTSDRASAASQSNPKAVSSTASIASAWGVDEFLEKSRLKKIKFSERNPALWQELLATANPLTLTLCRHLEGEAEDKACRCGYPGSVWADPEHVLFTMGDQWGGDESMQTPRLSRSTEIATAQLLTCLYNNADWLIGLAAQGMAAPSGGETGTGSTVGNSPVVSADAPGEPS